MESAQRNPSLDLTWVQHSSFNKHPFGRDAAARSMSSVSFIASSQLVGPLWPCSPSMLKVHLILTTKKRLFRLSGVQMQFKFWSAVTFLLPTMSCHMNPYLSGKLTVPSGCIRDRRMYPNVASFLFKLRAVFKSKLLFKQIMNQAEDALFPQVERKSRLGFG